MKNENSILYDTFSNIFLVISNTQITFKPFSISLPYWHRAISIFLISIGIWLYNIGEYRKGYEAGIEKTIKYIEDKSKQNETTKRKEIHTKGFSQRDVREL